MPLVSQLRFPIYGSPVFGRQTTPLRFQQDYSSVGGNGISVPKVDSFGNAMQWLHPTYKRYKQISTGPLLSPNYGPTGNTQQGLQPAYSGNLPVLPLPPQTPFSLHSGRKLSYGPSVRTPFGFQQDYSGNAPGYQQPPGPCRVSSRRKQTESFLEEGRGSNNPLEGFENIIIQPTFRPVAAPLPFLNTEAAIEEITIHPTFPPVTAAPFLNMRPAQGEPSPSSPSEPWRDYDQLGQQNILPATAPFHPNYYGSAQSFPSNGY